MCEIEFVQLIFNYIACYFNILRTIFEEDGVPQSEIGKIFVLFEETEVRFSDSESTRKEDSPRRCFDC